jgi:hypothetical protein
MAHVSLSHWERERPFSLWEKVAAERPDEGRA